MMLQHRKQYWLLLTLIFTANSYSQNLMTLDELRSRLRHKFALDIAVSRNLEETDFIGLPDQTGNLEAIEEFFYHYHYRLYKVRSYDTKSEYYLLTENIPELYTLILLHKDSRYLDESHVRNANMYFDTLNGGPILRVEMHTTGSGFTGHHLKLFAIINDELRQLFHCYLSSFDHNPPGDTTIRTLGEVSFQDHNGDGFTDILLNTKEDYLDDTEAILGIKSATQELYLWDNTKLAFTRKH